MNIAKLESIPGYLRGPELTEKHVAFYQENGYLVILDALDTREIEELKREAAQICRGKRGEIRLLQQDSTEVQDYPELDDDAVIQKYLCIHQPHTGSDLIESYLSHPALQQTLARLIGSNVKCMQSMLFVKSAGKPGQAWHQDEFFIPTRDRSLTGGWIAIDDATVENGCLWIIPGSHRSGILWPMYPHNNDKYDCAHMAYDFPYDESEDAIPVEVPAGGIVLFNGYLLHKSLPNRLEKGFRRVLVNHYMSAESLLPWNYEEGKSMARQDDRNIVMIAGDDPYAYKGVKQERHMHVRPSGQGGCGDGRLDLESYRKTIAT